jgi:uroporphyrinogen-III synthase
MELARALAAVLADTAPADTAPADTAPADPGALAGPGVAGGRAARASGGSGRVLVTREPGRPGVLAGELRTRGLEPIVIPTIELRPAAPGGPLDAAAADLPTFAWVVVTSAAGADALADAVERTGGDLVAARLAAVGPATAEALAARGAPASFVPSRTTGQGIGDELPIAPGDRVLLARADAADGALPARLRARGAVVDEVAAYHTVEAPEGARRPLRALFADGGVDAIVFASGSAVRGLLALLGPVERRAALATPACCIGPTTATAARESGFLRVEEAADQSSAALADLVAGVVASTPAQAPAPTPPSRPSEDPR